MDVKRLLWDFRTSGPVSHSVKTACCLLAREEHLEHLWAASGRVFDHFDLFKFTLWVKVQIKAWDEQRIQLLCS